MGFIGCLQLAFIILKLCNVIAWSWWIILIPTYVATAIILLYIVVEIYCEFHSNKTIIRKGKKTIIKTTFRSKKGNVTAEKTDIKEDVK